MNTIETFLPTSEELENGITAAPAPPIPEQIYYLEKIAAELGFLNPEQIAADLLPCLLWDGIHGTLKIDGKSIQLVLRNLAKEQPELAKPDGEARIENTLNMANLHADPSLLNTPKLKAKFISKYGQERLQEIQRLTCAEAKAIEERIAARRVSRMQSAGCACA